MKKHFSTILMGMWCCLAVLLWSAAAMINTTSSQMQLVWYDEFDQEGLPDASKWSYEQGDGCPNLCGWGNEELQYYTSDRKENARIENGYLIIEARREPTGKREYSSAKLVSRRKGDWKYGKIVASAKLPQGTGVWPAIWMLPTEWSYGGWPASGEIDIMEFVGYMPDSLFGSIHTKQFNHKIGTQVTKGIYSNTLSSSFHEYAIEWDEEKIVFSFDGKPYQTFTNRNEGSDAWPFDRDFHMIMNVAVGGLWGGKMGVDTSIWPQRMEVDYVRVYQK